MKKSLEPRAVLDALLNETPLDGFSSSDVTRARSLARSVETASVADLAQLPELLAAAVLEASILARDIRLAQELANAPTKSLAKAAKKALYRFRSLGVTLPESPRPAPSVPARAETVEELPWLLSVITGWGEQSLVAPRPLRGGGLEITQIIVSDQRGMVGLGQRQESRGEYRRRLKEIRAKGPPVREIGRDEARAVLSRAAALNLMSKTPYPEGSEELMRYLGATAADEPLTLPSPQPEDERLLTDAKRLFDEPEMRSWLPPEDELRVLAAKLDEVLHSPLELTETQRSEQLLHQTRAAARAFFTPEQRKLYAGRVWQMAQLFEETGRKASADVAKAQARQLFHSQPDAVAFGEILYERVLSLMKQRQRQQQSEQASAPTGAVSSSAPTTERRSPGGLILP